LTKNGIDIATVDGEISHSEGTVTKAIMAMLE
jgi:tellurite resistance protein